MRLSVKIQTMRKDAGFEVMDHIRVSIQDNEKIAGIVQKNEEQIKSEVLSQMKTKYDGAVGFHKRVEHQRGESYIWCRGSYKTERKQGI